jgi:hypothetical protein
MMEMDFARFRVAALLLLTMAAGAFGYSFGWERGQIAAKHDTDMQLKIMQDRISQHWPDAAGEPPVPLASRLSARHDS